MNTPAKLRSVLEWLDNGTGLCSGLRQCAERTQRGCPWINRWWPTAIVFTFAVQVITGFVLWMHYSPSAQTAWESVFFIQYQLAGGWFVRGVHHFAGQVLAALTGLYAFQLVLAGAYRHPREFVFWAAVLMFLAALGSCLTGDLLSWDQDRYSATQTRVSFTMLLPGIGGYLYKLVVGGPAFGHLTLARFFALHVAVLGGGSVLLLAVHTWLSRRARCAADAAGGQASAKPGKPYWPDVFAQNAVVCLAVMAVILLLVFQNAFRGDHSGQPAGQYLGAELGAPADPDPANAYAASRPEWSFRGLYVFTHYFSGAWQIVPIFVVTSLVMLYIFAMPLIAALCRPGHALNVVVALVLFAGLGYMSFKSYRDDARDADFQAAVEQGRQSADRAIALARGQGIPVGGALSLLLSDPQSQGPKLFEQHCGACHAWTPAEGKSIVPADQSAPELYQFASRAWIEDILDKTKIGTNKYLGNTRFVASLMAKYLESHKLEAAQRSALAAALAAEARLKSAAGADDEKLIADGRRLIVSEGCTRCHRFHEHGTPGDAPDLTGYGSREWLIGVVADPAHDWFYSTRNDRMPAYAEFPEMPAKNRLSSAQVDVLVSWLRGEWYEPAAAEQAEAKPATAAPAVDVALGKWEARRTGRPAAPPTDARGQALAVFELAQCAVCHDFTDAKGQGIRSRQPSAPTLYRFASAEWLRGLLDPEQVAGPKYYGTNDQFKKGEMVGFVQDTLADNIEDVGTSQLEKLIKQAASDSKQVEFCLKNLPELKKEIGDDELRKRVEQAVKDNKFPEFVTEHAESLIKQLGQKQLDDLIVKLAAGAQQDEAGEGDEDTQNLFEDLGCADCHKYYEAGDLGSAPDLTGYGSREWLSGIINNPEQKRFYAKKNAGMPAYHLFPDQPQKNLLTPEQVQQLADLLRGKFDSR